MDPDDFSSGFGVWSGTSFAAPVLAGEVAAALAAAVRATVARRARRDLAVDRPWPRAHAASPTRPSRGTTELAVIADRYPAESTLVGRAARRSPPTATATARPSTTWSRG